MKDEEVKEMVAGLAVAQAETDRLLKELAKEADRRQQEAQQEADRRQQEADRRDRDVRNDIFQLEVPDDFQPHSFSE